MKCLNASLVRGLAALSMAIGGQELIAGEEQAKARSPEQIRAVVEGLQKEDVAWRQVQWRTCLIDGLRESRKTEKPLLLWVFIDRPIDDERC